VKPADVAGFAISSARIFPSLLAIKPEGQATKYDPCFMASTCWRYL